MENENMKKKVISIILILTCVLFISCSQKNVTLDDIQDQTKEVFEGGYIMTSNVFVPEGTFMGKIGGEFGEHTDKMYVKKNKIRIDSFYKDYEIRLYTLLVAKNTVITTACTSKDGPWSCKELFSVQKQKIQDEEALKKLDQELFNTLTPLPDKLVEYRSDNKNLCIGDFLKEIMGDESILMISKFKIGKLCGVPFGYSGDNWHKFN